MKPISILQNLNESEEINATEEYWNAKELDRRGFVALLKFNEYDANGNKYLVTNDSNEICRFNARNDEEAIEIFRTKKYVEPDFGEAKLNEASPVQDTNAVLLLSKDKSMLYQAKAENTVLHGFDSYIMWNLYLVAGKAGEEWLTPDNFSEDLQFESFAQYMVQESLVAAAEANDFKVVTSDDNLDTIEVKQN